VVAGEGLPAQTSCRVLDVTDSGYYAWRGRGTSAREVRHAWLTDLIRQVHASSNGIYGARRVHAELTLGHGVMVGHNGIEMLMRRAGIKGLPGNKRPRRVHQPPTAADPGRPALHPARTQPAVGHRHHRTPNSGREGLLRRRAGRLLPQGGRLVHRLDADSQPGHQRSGHGHRQPPPNGGHPDPLRSRGPDRAQPVVATPAC